jgi:hypothetical protein
LLRKDNLKLINIDKLREYYKCDMAFITVHAAERFRQRGIKAKDIRNAVNTGEIIEQYPEDFPFPSCLILGKDSNGQCIHVVMSDEGTSTRIITAYYPDKSKWSEDFRARKEGE